MKKTYPVIMLTMSIFGGEIPEDIESGLYSLADDTHDAGGLGYTREAIQSR